MKNTRFVIVASLLLASAGWSAGAQAQQSSVTFFVTSSGPGKGADLGGLAGADQRCQTLANAVGASGRTWRAYLSTQAVDGQPAVNARDRIGRGPWQNAKGVVVAKDVDELHGNNNLTKQTALTEKADVVNSRGDTPNMHDALTGTQADGRAFPPGEDRTCRNWTSSTQGAAMLGHIDRQGLRDDAESKSWNAAHPSRGPGGGCTQDDLKSTGGNGLFTASRPTSRSCREHNRRREGTPLRRRPFVA
jgi:hypothetical protein